ncbi:hypothetical protein MHU86_1984 [Fragilaria crotonensis]|nr:hypothetical protein MHU86_1984 [Fragilaria crotonensis]
MNAPLTITNEEEDAPKTAFDKALSSLVNFDDISAPADKDIQEAMRKKQEEQTRKSNKSKALPPAANNMVGSGATLAQISQVKQDAAMAGALVIRGDGPPPLQPQGFGIVHGQGYYGSRAGYY